MSLRKIATLTQRVRQLEASSKKVKIYKLIQEYNNLVGRKQKPNKEFIKMQFELGLEDETIRRLEQTIQQVLADRDL